MRTIHAAAALISLGGLLAPMATAQHPILDIKVSGNQRLPASVIIAESGLHKGQVARQADLNAAAQKLADTGFFSSVSYQYDPKTVGGATGYALTLVVSEQARMNPVALEIPGFNTDQLWMQLKAADPLLDKEMPANKQAADRLKRAIEAVLRKSNYAEQIVIIPEADLKAGRMTMICRPVRLPKVAALEFQGNSDISTRALEGAMQKVALGQDYTERDFRQKLDLNVKPLYEEAGHLTVSFPRVMLAGDNAVTVTTAIDEGPRWKLGKVSLTGDALPLADMHEAVRFDHGAPANWKQFMEEVEQLEKVLKRDGYIHVQAQPVRSFRDAESIVDVAVEFDKGPQFHFGELHIEGLDEATQKRLATLWNLPAGAPMNEPYVHDFVRSAMPLLRGKYRTFNSELRVKDAAKIVDVMLKFH